MVPSLNLPGPIRAGLLAMLLLATLLPGADARPRPDSRLLTPAGSDAAPVSSDESVPPESFLIVGASASDYDTSWYGGTVWAADSNRWEAIPGGIWTFDSGVGSSIQSNAPANGKPNGYHVLMEGWKGLGDMRDSSAVFHRSTTCVITGSWSMWLGHTVAELTAAKKCYAAGQGYGNSWNSSLERTFNYSGSGNVTLQFRYAVDSEPDFDFFDVDVVTSSSATPVHLGGYTGLVSGQATFTLQQGNGTLPSGPGTVTIRFLGSSDGGYSDEDGYFASTCGLVAVDDITLSGAITHSATFESGDDGWLSISQPVVNDFSDLRLESGFPPPSGFFCGQCGLRDSVLVFIDPSGHRTLEQSTLVISPWIDLRAGGDVGHGGAILDMMLDSGPLGISPAMTVGGQYYPAVCPATGKIGVSPIRFGSVIFFFGGPLCGRYRSQMSFWVPPSAEQARVVIGPITSFDNLSNPPPYVDNVRFGVFGPKSAPSIVTTGIYLFQDNFATDGTLNPGSTARIDTSWPSSASTSASGGDSLTVTCAATNCEMRVVFHVHPGPFTNPAGLATAAARWTPESMLGAAWYSARLDTAEVHGSVSAQLWMTNFHEADPGFQGTDTTLDPAHPNELLNDIFPDDVLTPGARIDYFVKARYIPPDPRNPTGQAWYITPDTTGGHFWEVEILPSSMAADSTWNCTLLIDGDPSNSVDRPGPFQSALNWALGPGTSNVEGTRFDRMNFKPSGNVIFGRRASWSPGATPTQALAYHTLVLAAGTASGNIFQSTDVTAFQTWLHANSGVDRRLWASGLALAGSLNGSNAASQSFMRNDLGVRLACTSVRGAGCPSGTTLDSTWCLPLGSATGAAFPTSAPSSAGGNGCPFPRNFIVLSVEPGITSAAGQINYVKNGLPAGFASITNNSPTPYSYRSVFDAVPPDYLRRTPGDPHDPGQCSNVTAMYERTLDVLTWLGTPVCPAPAVAAVPDPSTPQPAPVLPQMHEPWPNPTAGGATIRFRSSGERVTIEIFDVTGRRVRTVLDLAVPVGDQQVRWDGRTDGGDRAANGLYFVRMVSGETREARKLLVVN